MTGQRGAARPKSAAPDTGQAPAGVRVRQSQESRSAATRAQVLDATLLCLRELGYRNTTLAQIQKRAGVSRGALLHHFKTKAELVAHAMASFYVGRLERHQRKLASISPTSKLRERLALMRAESEAHLPVTAEFTLAMRTDKELAEAFDAAMSSSMEPTRGGYARLLPEFEGDPDVLWIAYVIGCFHRGLAMEGLLNPPDVTDRIAAQFAQLLEAYVTTRGPARRAAARR